MDVQRVMLVDSDNRPAPDWQVTSFLLDGMFVETDCNSGRKRWLKKSQCSCGQPVLIEFNSSASNRADNKRVFYPDQEDQGGCVFRCKACRQPAHLSVPGAEYASGED